MSDKRINTLAILPAIIPSTQILIIKPLLTLHQQKKICLTIRFEDQVKISDFNDQDVVVFSRNFSPICIDWLNYLLEHKIPFIYDIDDNFFDIPQDYSVFANTVRQPQYQAVITRFIHQASLVRVYSLEMIKRLNDFSVNASFVTGPIDWKNILNTKKKKSRKINILYATSRINDDKLSTIFENALVEIIKKYDEKINVYFWGFHPELNITRKNIQLLNYEMNYDRYLRKLSSSSFDIGLAPLKDDVFHRSKSNIKFREYAASGIVGVYSNVNVYANDVGDNQNGILVENTTESWFNGISMLIENNSLRTKIKNNAFEYAKTHFSQTSFEEQWLKDIQQVAEAKFPSFDFPPSIGMDAIAAKPKNQADSPNPIRKYLSILLRNKPKTIISMVKMRLSRKYQLFVLQFKLKKDN